MEAWRGVFVACAPFEAEKDIDPLVKNSLALLLDCGKRVLVLTDETVAALFNGRFVQWVEAPDAFVRALLRDAGIVVAVLVKRLGHVMAIVVGRVRLLEMRQLF